MMWEDTRTRCSLHHLIHQRASQGTQMVKNRPANAGDSEPGAKSQDTEASSVSIKRRMDEEDTVVLIYTVEYYSSIKKKGIRPLSATWMHLEMTALSEISQAKRNIVLNHTRVGYKEKWYRGILAVVQWLGLGFCSRGRGLDGWLGN